MSGKMFLLYAERTHNVLAAVSMNAPPDGTLLPAALAGDVLMLRNLFDPKSKAAVPGQFAVPVANLAVAPPIDADAAVLANPMGSRIGDDKRPTGLDPSKLLTVTMEGTILKVTVLASVTRPIPVLVCAQATAGGAAKPYPTEITSGDEVDVQLEIPSSGGTYNLLVLAEGYLPAVLSNLFP
jgi:hypothetical protein